MNRIDQLFSKKQHNVLNIYCTAGYPSINDTVSVMQSLEAAGADMVELGMPFSDPLADGPVIQASSTKAIANGMSIKKLFEQLKDVRKSVNLPVILMGYINPVLQFGVENFLEHCAATGVDGIILPDLPMDEYEEEYKPLFDKHGLHLIFIITPETSDARIRKIDGLSRGFVYAVSSSSTTGKDKEFAGQKQYFERIKNLQLKNPVLIGFGIKDKATFEAASAYSNGAIIGSAFVKALETSNDVPQTVNQFVKSIIN